MSIAPVSTSMISQQLPAYFHQRAVDLKQLDKDLQAGDLSAAQQDYNSIQTLAQNGPIPNGDAFVLSWRQQDFSNVGQALQSGDLQSAQQAFAQLAETFGLNPTQPSSGSSADAGTGISITA